MSREQKGKIIKCDQKVNITATFGSDMVLEGSTGVPNLILKYYSKIGITDIQMMILIQMFRLRTEECDYYPAPERLAETMSLDAGSIEEQVHDLLDKEVLALSEYYDYGRNEVFTGYDFEPLFLRISDIWAFTRTKELEETEALLRNPSSEKDDPEQLFDENTFYLAGIFEKEFGRPLSPMEMEQISRWTEESGVIIVKEALRRAVMGGKYNFKYINGILYEWKKNNLRSLDDINRYEEDYQKRRSGRVKQGQEGQKKAETGTAKEKALLQRLYLS
ncbi:MAG: DnaD domain protein [Firmicutes bacterium]|nr:DnaD domain protein [Bacillota bacterium]